MINKPANTIMLTTKCSGGCSHCPFSQSDLEKLYLPFSAVEKNLNKSQGKLTILSGGEPFEHPQILEILQKLNNQITPFRIATGGFVNLNPWIKELQILNSTKKILQGISMGTDVISSRVGHSRWVPIWKNNIHLFFKFQIPYSLTFSIGSDLDFIWLNLWKWADLFDSWPNFIYLRYLEADAIQIWLQKLDNTFKNIPVILDNYGLSLPVSERNRA